MCASVRVSEWVCKCWEGMITEKWKFPCFSGVVKYGGSLVDIGKLIQQLEKSENARSSTEEKLKELQKELSTFSPWIFCLIAIHTFFFRYLYCWFTTIIIIVLCIIWIFSYALDFFKWWWWLIYIWDISFGYDNSPAGNISIIKNLLIFQCSVKMNLRRLMISVVSLIKKSRVPILVWKQWRKNFRKPL